MAQEHTRMNKVAAYLGAHGLLTFGFGVLAGGLPALVGVGAVAGLIYWRRPQWMPEIKKQLGVFVTDLASHIEEDFSRLKSWAKRKFSGNKTKTQNKEVSAPKAAEPSNFKNAPSQKTNFENASTPKASGAKAQKKKSAPKNTPPKP